MSEDKRFTLRMDAKLFELIKKSAAKNRRSVAKEIEFVLFQWSGLDANVDYGEVSEIPLEVDEKASFDDCEK